MAAELRTLLLGARSKVIVGCIGAAVVGAVTLIVGVSVLFWSFRDFLIPSHKMPAALKRGGVLHGEGVLSRVAFYANPSLGDITDIAYGEYTAEPGPELAIAGLEGAVFLDDELRLKASVKFSSSGEHIDILDVNGDGRCEFVNRGGVGWQDASLIGSHGAVMWSYGGMPGVDDMTAGDIDGDGSAEFVVGFNGGGGVHLVDADGRRRWQQADGNVWHVELLDVDGDGLPEIVHSNAAGQITVRDKQGNVISRAKPNAYFSDFSLCRWPSKQDKWRLLLAEDDLIWLFDVNGNVIAKMEAPLAGSLGTARGTSIKLLTDEPSYFAVVVEFDNWRRSVLYVYSPNQELVYQEVIEERCSSISAIAVAQSTNERLLVGGEGRVWEYTPVGLSTK